MIQSSEKRIDEALEQIHLSEEARQRIETKIASEMRDENNQRKTLAEKQKKTVLSHTRIQWIRTVAACLSVAIFGICIYNVRMNNQRNAEGDIPDGDNTINAAPLNDDSKEKIPGDEEEPIEKKGQEVETTSSQPVVGEDTTSSQPVVGEDTTSSQHEPDLITSELSDNILRSYVDYLAFKGVDAKVEDVSISRLYGKYSVGEEYPLDAFVLRMDGVGILYSQAIRESYFGKLAVRFTSGEPLFVAIVDENQNLDYFGSIEDVFDAGFLREFTVKEIAMDLGLEYEEAVSDDENGSTNDSIPDGLIEKMRDLFASGAGKSFWEGERVYLAKQTLAEIGVLLTNTTSCTSASTSLPVGQAYLFEFYSQNGFNFKISDQESIIFYDGSMYYTCPLSEKPQFLVVGVPKEEPDNRDLILLDDFIWKLVDGNKIEVTSLLKYGDFVILVEKMEWNEETGSWRSIDAEPEMIRTYETKQFLPNTDGAMVRLHLRFAMAESGAWIREEERTSILVGFWG